MRSIRRAKTNWELEYWWLKHCNVHSKENYVICNVCSKMVYEIDIEVCYLKQHAKEKHEENAAKIEAREDDIWEYFAFIEDRKRIYCRGCDFSEKVCLNNGEFNQHLKDKHEKKAKANVDYI